MGEMVPLYRVTLVRAGGLDAGEERDCSSALAVHRLFQRLIGDADREHVLALYLDVHRRLIGVHEVSVGAVAETFMVGREVFKAGILLSAAYVVVAHNHPSGDPAPSPQDCARTRVLEHAGLLVGIQLLDHVVVGHQRYYSFRNEGMLQLPDSEWVRQSRLEDPRLARRRRRRGARAEDAG